MSCYYTLSVFKPHLQKLDPKLPTGSDLTVGYEIEDLLNEYKFNEYSRLFVLGDQGEFGWADDDELEGACRDLSIKYPDHVIRIIVEDTEAYNNYMVSVMFFYQGRWYWVQQEPFDPDFELNLLNAPQES